MSKRNEPSTVTLHIQLQWPPEQLPLCRGCNPGISTYDHRAARYWRHLDCMGYRTELYCKLPRTECPTHGVRTVHTPWAEPAALMTPDQESYCIRVLESSAMVTAVARLLGLSYYDLHHIQQRAVRRGLLRRDLSGVTRLCIHDKSFQRGSCLVTVLSAPGPGSAAGGRARANQGRRRARAGVVAPGRCAIR